MRLTCRLSVVLILFSVGMLADLSYARIDPQPIIGMWLFDEDNGDEVIDSSGHEHTG